MPRLSREQWQANRDVPSPPHNSQARATPAIVYPRRTNDAITATWIGHSTVLLQAKGLNIITDPVFSDRASPLQWIGPRRVMDPAVPLRTLPPLDVVLISHNHYDHLDRRAVKHIARANPAATFVAPLGVGARLRTWGCRHVVELDWFEHTLVQGAQITATPARHFSARTPFDRDKTLWCGFAIALEQARILYAGDTAYHPDFGTISERCGPFDFVMIPIGAYDPQWMMQSVHANPEEAVRIFQDIVTPHPRAPLPLMLGVHWGTFRLTTEPMSEPPQRTRLSWRERALDEQKLWIAKFGETRCVTG